MSDNVISLPEPPDMAAGLIGPIRQGNSLIVDGRAIPGIHVHDRGKTIDFILDGRLAFEFPREWAYLAASFAANAMAIGAGFPHLSADRPAPFAPQVFVLADPPK